MESKNPPSIPVYDPASGAAGFLVAAYEHMACEFLRERAQGCRTRRQTFERGFGDRLEEVQWRKLQTESFYGNDVDPKMVSLASLNLALRSLPDVRILKRDVLTTSFDRSSRPRGICRSTATT